MKTLIIYSNSYFPLSAVAGSIIAGKLPARYAAGKIQEMFAGGIKEYSGGRICSPGQASI